MPKDGVFVNHWWRWNDSLGRISNGSKKIAAHKHRLRENIRTLEHMSTRSDEPGFLVKVSKGIKYWSKKL